MVSRIVVFFAGFFIVLCVVSSPGTTLSSPALAQNQTKTSSAVGAIRDVPYTFDKAKLGAAQNSFQFQRSFVDYFYLVTKENQATISLLNSPTMTALPTAVCMGDAHPENFGVLLQKGGVSFFTANDIDDSEIAPAVLDLFRFMVSSRLYDATVSLDALLDAYTDGAAGKSRATPSIVDDMLAKSRSRSTEPSKSDVDQGKFVPPPGSTALTAQELSEVSAVLQKSLGGWNVVDSYATKKVGGGSGGLQRYEVLLSSAKGKLLHVEFKEEVAASILPFVAAPSTVSARLTRALDATLASSVDLIYQVVPIAGREMLVRPRYSAFVGSDLDKNTPAENRDLMAYEAFTLGQLHARTISDAKVWMDILRAAPRSEWSNDVDAMTAFMNKKYRSLP